MENIQAIFHFDFGLHTNLLVSIIYVEQEKNSHFMPVLHKGRSVGQSHKEGLKIGLNSGMVLNPVLLQ